MRVRAKSQLQLADTQRQPRTGDVRAGGDGLWMEIGEESGVGNGSDRRSLLGACVDTKLSGPLGHPVG